MSITVTINDYLQIKMSEVDKWFLALSDRQKLQALGYYMNWNNEACVQMTVEELITIIGFPPQHVDNSNPLCPVITLQSLDSITGTMFLDKWNEISAEGKEQIKMNIEQLG